jgi:hypothetical protein
MQAAVLLCAGMLPLLSDVLCGVTAKQAGREILLLSECYSSSLLVPLHRLASGSRSRFLVHSAAQCCAQLCYVQPRWMCVLLVQQALGVLQVVPFCVF